MTIIKPATFSQVTPSTALQDAKAMLESARSSQTAGTERQDHRKLLAPRVLATEWVLPSIR